MGSLKAAIKNLCTQSQIQNTAWHFLLRHLSFLQTSRQMLWPEFDYMTSNIFDYWGTRSSLELTSDGYPFVTTTIKLFVPKDLGYTRCV